MTCYLDCNATTPVEPAVAEELLRYTVEEFGNAGSRTHSFGARAKRRVNEAREQVAAVVAAAPQEVIFTSGATEANNIALLGLEPFGRKIGKRHIISTEIEHKAVLEPLEQLAARGFEVELVSPASSGCVAADAIFSRLREDTLAVSLMHVNNETGMIQPIAELADAMTNHSAFLHVDAAQGFGKDLEALRHPRIDLSSLSAHKVYGPKGIGALICRRQGGRQIPLSPLLFGGGQERGLRPGTVPVALCAALGTAAEIAVRDHHERSQRVAKIRLGALATVQNLDGVINGDPDLSVASTLNVSLPGLNSEAAMIAMKGIAAASNGSACTSRNYEPSHVLAAMGLEPERASGAIRFSWSHLGAPPDWDRIETALASFISVSAK